MRRAIHSPFILAVSPSPRGFAFVLFEGPTTPFDWGIKEMRGDDKNARTLAAITKLIREYHPAALVIEQHEGEASRRGKRIRALLSTLAEVAAIEQLTVVRYTRFDVRRTFKGEQAQTKPDIAKAVAARIDAFATRLPPIRKIWMSEHPRQSLFDAAALGLTFFARAQGKRRPIAGETKTATPPV
jgi:hypothetical protein